MDRTLLGGVLPREPGGPRNPDASRAAARAAEEEARAEALSMARLRHVHGSDAVTLGSAVGAEAVQKMTEIQLAVETLEKRRDQKAKERGGDVVTETVSARVSRERKMAADAAKRAAAARAEAEVEHREAAIAHRYGADVGLLPYYAGSTSGDDAGDAITWLDDCGAHGATMRSLYFIARRCERVPLIEFGGKGQQVHLFCEDLDWRSPFAGFYWSLAALSALAMQAVAAHIFYSGFYAGIGLTTSLGISAPATPPAAGARLLHCVGAMAILASCMIDHALRRTLRQLFTLKRVDLRRHPRPCVAWCVSRTLVLADLLLALVIGAVGMRSLAFSRGSVEVALALLSSVLLLRLDHHVPGIAGAVGGAKRVAVPSSCVMPSYNADWPVALMPLVATATSACSMLPVLPVWAAAQTYYGLHGMAFESAVTLSAAALALGCMGCLRCYGDARYHGAGSFARASRAPGVQAVSWTHVGPGGSDQYLSPLEA